MKESDSIFCSENDNSSASASGNNLKRFAATVGTFDGVHLGHLRVLDTLREAAAKRGLEPLAITFADHPLAVIAPGRRPAAIMSSAQKLALLKEQDVSIHILDFTPAKAALSAAEWLSSLHEHHNIDCIVIGYDNTFGHDGRTLSADDYVRLGESLGIEVVAATELEGISSSAIRRAIAAGNIGEVNRMLGRTFTLEGTIEEGDHIGRTIGFPTANLRLDPPLHRAVPPFGVYASTVTLPDGRRLPGVTNIGLRPSVSDIAETPKPRIETYIIGYHGQDLYGQRLAVGLLKFMRPERRFPSLEALKNQLGRDIENRKSIL